MAKLGTAIADSKRKTNAALANVFARGENIAAKVFLVSALPVPTDLGE